jgi:hypothetical protein
VATQSLGTLIAAVMVALVAIFVGFGYTPAIRYYVVLGIATLFGIFAGLVFTISAFRAMTSRMRPDSPFSRHPFSFGLLYVLATLVAIIGFWIGDLLLMMKIQSYVASWTGYVP